MPEIDLRGIIPAIVTPLTAAGEVDHAALRQYVDWLVAQGPLGLAVNVDTGEGPHLTPTEKRAILETVVATAAGRCRVVAGIAGPSTAQGVANARDAQAAGADALLIFPIPAYLGTPLNPEVPYRYHAAIAEAVDLPLVLFNLQPKLGGVLFTTEVLHKLITIPAVAAIKEASFDALTFVEVKTALQTASRPITLLTGNDNFIYESFVLGAEGALLGFATLGTREHVDLLAAWRRGDLATAEALGRRLQPLADVVFGPPVTDYRARTKVALAMLGVLTNTSVRPPLLPTPPEHYVGLRQALLTAGLLGEPQPA